MPNPDEVSPSWATEFKGLYRYGRAFTLTRHPRFIGRPGRFADVEYLRAGDVAEMWSHR